MNKANDSGEQVAQHQRKDGSIDAMHCVKKANSATATSLRINGNKTVKVEQSKSQSQITTHSTLQNGPKQTAALAPPVEKASDEARMPPTEIIIPKGTVSGVSLKRKDRGHQEALHTQRKKMRVTEKLEPATELDLDDTSGESVEESEQGIGRYNDADVLAGRGGSINVHPGNQRFRKLIDQYRREYLQARKTVKPQMNKAIVNIVRRKYGGRFLKRESDGLWYEIGDARAQEKVGQAFRQKAPEMRKILFGVQKRPQVESQELLQAGGEQQEIQIKQQHLLVEQRDREQLEQRMQQQQQQLQLVQHQLALATATRGSPTALNPAMLLLVNPLLQLQQQQQQQAAMTNPLLNALLVANNLTAPVVYPFLQVPASTLIQTFPNTTTPSTMINNAMNVTQEGLEQTSSGIVIGSGGHVLPKTPSSPGNGPS
jgi:hypothetical protein